MTYPALKREGAGRSGYYRDRGEALELRLATRVWMAPPSTSSRRHTLSIIDDGPLFDDLTHRVRHVDSSVVQGSTVIPADLAWNPTVRRVEHGRVVHELARLIAERLVEDGAVETHVEPHRPWGDFHRPR